MGSRTLCWSKRHSRPGRDVRPDGGHEGPQPHPSGVELSHFKSHDGSLDRVEQPGGDQPRCYIATRSRRRRIFRRARRPARIPASTRFLARIYAPDRSRMLRETDRTPVRLPAPPRFTLAISAACDQAIHFVPLLCPNGGDLDGAGEVLNRGISRACAFATRDRGETSPTRFPENPAPWERLIELPRRTSHRVPTALASARSTQAKPMRSCSRRR